MTVTLPAARGVGYRVDSEARRQCSAAPYHAMNTARYRTPRAAGSETDSDSHLPSASAWYTSQLPSHVVHQRTSGRWAMRQKEAMPHPSTEAKQQIAPVTHWHFTPRENDWEL
jgi:hypothetical protein